jgi:hypothetical protein
MSSLRSFVSLPFALLVATTVAGCGNDKPKPDPSAAATTATDTGNAKGRLNLRTPLAPQVKVDPQATKDYRVDVCYFGTMTLRQARDAYLASLGGAEPSEKKLPSFGGAPAPTAPTAPTTSGAAKPGTPAATPAKPATPPAATPAKPATPPAATPAKPATPPATSGAPAAKPAASGMPAASGAPAAAAPGDQPGRRPFDVALRAPHERNARACSVAAGLKDVAMGDVDTALQTYAPFAVELAKAIQTATTYYSREEYKKDAFAKGKELHKQLVEAFGKLDDMEGKLGTALDAWRKAHPADAAKQDEGEKVAMAAYDDARNAILAVATTKPNVAGFKDSSAKLDKSLEALKGFAASHPQDPWSKMMVPSLESMLKAAKEAESKVTDKGVDGDTFLVLTNSFVSVIEARYRALSRSTTMKAAPPTPAAAAPVGTATETPKPE